MKILMVCLGNICRSPMAQGIMEYEIKQRRLQWEVDSAGTSGWHDGEAPDPRAVLVSKRYNVDISKQMSRKITKQDLKYFDLILAMDKSNLQEIHQLCSNDSEKSKVKLILNYFVNSNSCEVPDPYYDGKFAEVFDLLHNAVEKVIEKHL